jgi:hypothetical protein
MVMKAIQSEERIHVHRTQFRSLPREFTWRGRRYMVQRIERTGSPTRAPAGGETRKDFFVLQTRQGLRCRISHDRRHEIWRLEQLLSSGG